MTNKLNLNDLAIFALIVKNRSFTKAAQEAGISKAWVSQKISYLEASLGVKLLKRTTRSLSLTQGGEILFAHCQKLLEEVSDAENNLRHYAKSPSGKLVITCPEITGLELMPILLDQFHAQYPDIRIRLMITDDFVDITQQGIDFAFRTGKLADSTYISRLIGNVPRCLVASPEYLSQHGPLKHPDELHTHKLLKHSSLSSWPLTRASQHFKFHLKDPAMESNSLLFLHEMAIQGHGIAFLPYYLCADSIRAKKLVKVLPKWFNADNQYYLVYHKDKGARYINQLFKDFILKSNLKSMVTAGTIHAPNKNPQ